MKGFFFLVVTLIGCANAKPYPAKRSSQTCSAFPKQLSGRLYMVTAEDSGSSTTIDMEFNLDENLQIMQAEATVDDLGPFNMIMDIKGGKMYTIYAGGCHAQPLEQSVLNLDDFKELKYKLSGKLGLNGAMVELYSFNNVDEVSGMITVEPDADGCIPVTFAGKGEGAAFTGSYLDLKTTADPDKFKIPEHCGDQQMSQRSLPALVHSFHLKKAVRRVFPWTPGKKRGFPWPTYG